VPTTALFALCLTLTGCEKLQPGYYLTPENLPTAEIQPQPADSETVIEITPTLPATIQSLDVTAPLPTTQASPTEPAPLSTETSFACAETEGRIVLDAINSAYTFGDVGFRVYLPPCYEETDVRYPYLIMLHGMQGEVMNDDQWDRLGLDEAATAGYLDGSLPPMIIIMPDGTDAQHDYDPGPYPDIIVDELIPYVETHYCAWDTSATRAIGGLSRGGYWAYSVAFLHPTLFDRVGGHSGFFYAGDFPPTNPYDMIPTAPDIGRLTMYLDHGAGDTLVDANVRSFAERLNNRGLDPEYIVFPGGGHNEDYWASHTADYLAFYAAEWSKDLSQFPSCDSPGSQDS
jgi:enterochelin esterase-like enzyme